MRKTVSSQNTRDFDPELNNPFTGPRRDEMYEVICSHPGAWFPGVGVSRTDQILAMARHVRHTYG